MDKKIIYLLLIFVFSNCNFSKKSNGLKSNLDHPTFLENDHFGIRVKPILNREYLVFLSWYIHVYGSSYPEKVMSILPQNSLNPDYGSDFEIKEHLQASTSILKNYIFNPKYIDYPLIGLSPTQIMEMQRWMSDRYHENILIERGLYNFNTNQKDEDSFSLEAFFVDQYLGDIKKNSSLGPFNNGNRIWRKEYLSTFRLPYQNEIDFIKSHPDFHSQLKKYSFDKKDFLWRWNQYYLDILPKEKKIILKHPFAPIEINCKTDVENNALADLFVNAILVDKNLEFTNTKYLNLGNPDGERDQYEGKYPYLEKGRFGQMEFVVVGVDDKNQPVVADPIQLQNKDLSENKIFRIAFNKTLRTQYLPK